MLDHQGRADGARQATAPDESERRFRALIEHSFDVIALLAIDGTILYASPSAQPMLGYAQGTVVGTSGFSLVHPEDVTVIAQLFSSLLTQPGTSVTSQFRIRRADGAWCWVESVETNLLQEPDVQAVVVNFRDISDRKAARAALEASEERYRCTFEDAGVGIAHVDLEGRWLWVNQKLCEIVGYRRDELISLTFQAITHPDDLDADLAYLRHLLDGELKTCSMEKRYIRKDGAHVWVSLTVSLVRTPSGAPQYFISVVEDISQRKQAEEERDRFLEAEQTAREEAEGAVQLRDEVLSTVSHDLKNPLTAIKGAVQLLQRRLDHGNPPTGEQLARSLTSIDGSASRMLTMIGELSDVARLRIGQPLDLHRRATDLVALIPSLAESAQTATDRHQVSVETDQAELSGNWDPERLQRVFSNLLANALKYSPGGGRIVARLVREDDRETGTGWAIVTVRDDGIGIPAYDLPHVFDRFYRASNVSERIEGSGVGLAGAKQIVEQHGGSIMAASTLGKGSTFTVVLPLAGEADNA